MPRSAYDHQPYFLQYGRQSKLGSTFGISPSYLSNNFSNYWNLVSNYLHAKLIKLGPEDLFYWVLTSDAISEVSQHDFNMEELTVSPKQVKLPRNKDNFKGITGIKTTDNSFKVVDTAEDKNIRETRYLASQQAKKKGKKLDLSVNPKFSQNYTNTSSSTQ